MAVTHEGVMEKLLKGFMSGHIIKMSKKELNQTSADALLDVLNEKDILITCYGGFVAVVIPVERYVYENKYVRKLNKKAEEAQDE